eukprot:6619230-Ditylum_brightwellii.AAC.1
MVMVMMMLDPKLEICVIKKLETGWSLSLYQQNVIKKDIRSIVSALFFLGNYYRYKDDDQKIYGILTAMSFKEK